jgi:hypothetical protein
MSRPQLDDVCECVHKPAHPMRLRTTSPFPAFVFSNHCIRYLIGADYTLAALELFAELAEDGVECPQLKE